MRGDALRDQVARVLDARYGDATIERKLGGKDADIFFSIKFPGGRPIKIAVECKDWKRPLQSKDITRIYYEYAPAFEKQEIDSLWIVAPHPLRGEQDETIRSFGLKLRFFTLGTLTHELMDFTPYLKHLIEEFEADGLPQYYVMPRTTKNVAIHDDIILPWLSQADTKPVAIIAEYGAGKTSYAKFLASYLAKNALTDLSALKPILLHLGQLTRQQSLRALVNSLFSDEFGIEGYKYNLFDILLEQGNFLIILDGFDEMKHAMRKRDIVSNFESIRQFMGGKKSKYILLGRPDPFLSPEDELPLRGRVKIGAQLIHDVTKTSFQVVDVDDFTDQEVERFLFGFLAKFDSNRQGDSKYASKRVSEIRDKLILDVVRRPVHAQMLGALAASPGWQISASSEYDLYHHFVSEFLDRETTQKDARGNVPVDERYSFMQKIAWWMLITRKATSFTADQVPDRIINTARRYFEPNDTDEVILREMLLGSILGRKITTEFIVEKEAYSFYFPHRSYWEFLVAEYIGSSSFNQSDFGKLLEGVSPQVVKFLRERDDRSFIANLLNGFRKLKEGADFQLLAQLSDAIRWETDIIEDLIEPRDFSLAPLLCAGAAMGKIRNALFLNYLERGIDLLKVTGQNSLLHEVVFYANLFYCTATQLSDEDQNAILSLCSQLNGSFFIFSAKKIGPASLSMSSELGIRVPIPKRIADDAYQFFIRCVSYEKEKDRNRVRFSANYIVEVLMKHELYDADRILGIWGSEHLRHKDVMIWADELLLRADLSKDEQGIFRQILSGRTPVITKDYR